MAVTASMVKELREMTGAGMMDCKKALNETNGNMDEAIEFLRKNGQAKAEKKAGRIAAEGIVMAEVKDDKAAAIVEVNSETDFVAKNADFQAYVKAVVNQALTTKAANMDEFMAEAWNEDAAKTVKDVLTEKIAVIGENLNIRRFEKVETEGCVVSYIHGGGRIGVLVEADTDVVNDEIKACLKNVAMQVAAMSPKYVSRDEVDQDFLEHEKEILLAQAKKAGFTPKYFGCDGMDGILALDGFDKSLAEGLMFLTPFTADAEDEKTQAFVKAYKDAFGDTPIQFAADAYDCVYTIKAAIEKSGVTPDKSVSDICDALKAAMTQIKMDCLTGKEITWSADGEPSKLPTVVVVEKGAYKVK